MRKIRRLSIRLLTAGIVALVLLVVLATVPPIIVKAEMTGWLEQHGELRVRIEKVTFNPFLLRLSIHALFAEGPYQNKFHWQKAAFSVNFWPLWKRRLIADNFTLRDAAVLVERAANGEWRIGGIRFKAGNAEKKKSPWEIGVRNVDLKNVLIRYRGPKIANEIVIDSASLDQFESWRPDRSSLLSVKATVGGGALTLRSQTGPLGKLRLVTAEINVSSVAIGWFSPFLRTTGIRGQSGTLSGRMDLRGTMGSHGALALSGQGSLTLAQIKAAMPSPPIVAEIRRTNFRGEFSLNRRCCGSTAILKWTRPLLAPPTAGRCWRKRPQCA